jgi:hypothetical protein
MPVHESIQVAAMKQILVVAAALEVAIGLALIIDSSLIARLLFGSGVSGTALALGRVAGLGFFSFGLACWPSSEHRSQAPALRGLLCYNLLVTIYLLYLGILGEWVGVLLWPAAALHGVLTLLLIRACLKTERTQDTKG